MKDLALGRRELVQHNQRVRVGDLPFVGTRFGCQQQFTALNRASARLHDWPIQRSNVLLSVLPFPDRPMRRVVHLLVQPMDELRDAAGCLSQPTVIEQRFITTFERACGAAWRKSTDGIQLPQGPFRLIRRPREPVSEPLTDRMTACLKTSKRSAAKVPRR